MLADLHPLQTSRINTLYSYDILDTPREADFDEIVALAARICDAPISVVNLIDKDRQWFKAEVGLGVRETPLATSLCSHVILQDDFVEIPDTLQDKRMADNPLCMADPGLRFYAGALLLAPNGLPVGTLCVLDDHPRELNDLQREALRVLSRQVMMQLELRRALKAQQTLAHEADHRVKNSLQTLTSVIRMYKRTVSDPEAATALDAVQRRVEAVGALHGELQVTSSGTADAATYLDRIMHLLRDSLPPHINISHEAENVEMTSSSVSALGMIVSEFVSNAVKHAFNDRTSGEITIRLARVDNGYELVCRDNGCGSSGKNVGKTTQENLGSRLLSAAAMQLDGTLETKFMPDGASLKLRF